MPKRFPELEDDHVAGRDRGVSDFSVCSGGGLDGQWVGAGQDGSGVSGRAVDRVARRGQRALEILGFQFRTGSDLFSRAGSKSERAISG